MSKKIVVVSMIKNEADIIESFIRHSLTFADEVIIADHCSGDKTTEILKSLQKEGLPIFVETYYRVELAHAEVMNALLQRAIREHGADLVLPIDGDEFLVNTDNDKPCREILEALRTDGLYQLNWRTYEPLYPREGENRFLLSRPCRRGHDFAVNQKQIVGKEIGLREGFLLGQGCHYSYWQHNKQEIARIIVPDIHIAHFHWRSDEQYAAKVVTSWINNVAKYSVNTITASYLKNCYEKLANGEQVHPGTVIENPENFDLRPFCNDFNLRYSDDVRPIPLRNLMSASVLMAEAYLEEKILRRKKKVTIVLPYAGDDEDLQQRLLMVEKQPYPFKEIFICCTTTSGDISHIPEVFTGQDDIYVKSSREETASYLSENTTGDYVIYIMPGESIAENILVKMIACIESQDQYYAFVAYTERWQSFQLSPFYDGFAVDEFKGMMAMAFRNMLLESGQYPAVEISGLLLRRNLIERCKWLHDCFIEDEPLRYMIWVRILNEAAKMQAAIGFLPSCTHGFSQRKKLTAEDIIWHQLEWFAVLQEYRDEIESGIYVAAQENFQHNKIVALPLRKEVSSSLWKQYEECCL